MMNELTEEQKFEKLQTYCPQQVRGTIEGTTKEHKKSSSA
jgi:hypothetical protein